MAIGAGRLRPGRMQYSVVDVGNTRGGMAAAITQAKKEEKVDQYAETVINRWGAGISKASVETSLAEMTATAMSTITRTAVGAGNTIQLKGTTGIGTSDYAQSASMKIFPIIDGVASATAQVEMGLAMPMFDLVFNFGETAQSMKVTFSGLPDENNGNNLLLFREV